MRKKTIRKIAVWTVAIPLLALSGCATANVARYPDNYYSPTNPQDIAVYSNFPPVPYEAIGEIDGSGNAYATWDIVANEMRKKAADIGGDAMIIQVQTTPVLGAINTPGSIRGNTSGFGNVNGKFQGNTYSDVSSYNSTSNYTYTPPTSTPMYGKYARGVVIKYKQNEGNSSHGSVAKTDFESKMQKRISEYPNLYGKDDKGYYIDTNGKRYFSSEKELHEITSDIFRGSSWN